MDELTVKLDYLIEMLEKERNGLRRFLTKEEAAEYMGMSAYTLDEYQRKGTLEIPSIKIGGMVRYDIRDMDNYCDSLPRRGVKKCTGE